MRWPPIQRGFTLLELMAVIVIIGLMATFAVASFDQRSRTEQLATEAQRFARLIELASQEAVLQSRTLGVQVDEREYTFVEYRAGHWQPYSSGPFRTRRWPAGIEAQPAPAAQAVPGAPSDDEPRPQVMVLPTGELTPYSLALSLADRDGRYVVQTNEIGEVHRQWREANP